MATIELSAKSLDEAKALAAKQLDVDASSVKIEVLEEVKGLFGKVTLKVRATAADPKPAAKAKPTAKKDTEPVAEKAPAKPAAKAAPVKAEKPAPKEEVKAEAKPAARGRAKPVAKKDEEAPAGSAEVVGGDEEDSRRSDYTATQEDAQLLLDTTMGIIEAGELNAVVEIDSVQGRYVNLKLDGKDAAYLVGKHGEVLNSLQYLLNVIGSKSLNTQARVTLDGNDYRKRREEALSQYAESIASQVKENQMEAVLDALPAFERRVIHKALQAIDGISTYSEGEEPNRRVVIAPAT